MKTTKKNKTKRNRLYYTMREFPVAVRYPLFDTPSGAIEVRFVIQDVEYLGYGSHETEAVFNALAGLDRAGAMRTEDGVFTTADHMTMYGRPVTIEDCRRKN